MTKREAAEKWVSGFNAIPHSIFEALWTHAGGYEGDGWNEVTKPCVGDRIGFTPEAVAAIFLGEVTGIGGQGLYQITLDAHIEQLDYSGSVFYVPEDAIYVERDSQLPKCETMWSFGDSRDVDWLRESGSLQRMSECGFRIYQHDEFGYFFGVNAE